MGLAATPLRLRLGVIVLLVAVLALIGGVTPAFAADDSIDPDRPDVAVSAKTVGAGRVQIESGVLLQRERPAPSGDDRDRRDQRRFAVEAVFRIGITNALELRAETEPYVRLRGREEADDHGDFVLSAKWRFFEPAEGSVWPMLALYPFVKLPVGGEPISTGKTDAGLLLVASFDLPGEIGLDLNAGGAAIGQTRPSGYLGQALVRASASREILNDLTVYGETFLNSRAEREGTHQVGIDAGLIWKLTKTFAVDVAGGTLVYGRGPDWLVRAGASVRFGR